MQITVACKSSEEKLHEQIPPHHHPSRAMVCKRLDDFFRRDIVFLSRGDPHDLGRVLEGKASDAAVVTVVHSIEPPHQKPGFAVPIPQEFGTRHWQAEGACGIQMDGASTASA